MIDALKTMMWGFPIKETLKQIRNMAAAEGITKKMPAWQEAANMCQDLLSSLDNDLVFEVHVSARDILVSAHDEYRRKGDVPMCRKIQAIIDKLKDGKNRVIKADLSYRVATESQLDKALEGFRDIGLENIRG